MLATAFLWLIILELFAIAALPLSFRAFARMPDRGFCFSKPLGLLLVGFGTWVIGLSHTIPNTRWSVILALVLVIFISRLAAGGQLREIWHFFRSNLSIVITMELLFVAVFLGTTLLRATVPDISHTEQPMDLMFLNATVASPHYPPNDPWLAGETVSYYYLGYLMVGAMAMVTGMATSIAYNLGLATFAAIGAVAAFGLTYNLVALARGSRDASVLAGLTSVFLVMVASNLVGTLELARASGAGDSGFWASVGVNGLTVTEPSSAWHPTGFWWWFRASRVIPGAITEFPAFSFLLGDMHPHVMSIGFVLLAAGISVQLYLQEGLLRARAVRHWWPLIFVSIIGIGSLAAINLWDFPLGLALMGLAVLLNGARNERNLRLGRSLVLSDGILVAGASTSTRPDTNVHTIRLYTLTNDVWQPGQSLEARVVGVNPEFGASVATDGARIAVGAPGASGSGLVCIYGKIGDRWIHRATLRPPETDSAHRFGQAVAVSGSTIAVATTTTTYVFRQSSSHWVLDAALPPYGPTQSMAPSISLDDDTLSIGMPSAHGGFVQMFERTTGVWLLRSVISAVSIHIHRFGTSVSLDGNQLAIGGYGSVAIFNRHRDGWANQAVIRSPEVTAVDSFASCIDIHGSHLVVGAQRTKGPAPNGGAAFVYENGDEGWVWQTKLTAGDTGVDANLGTSVSIDRESIALGAPGGGHGGIYIYQRTLDRWTLSKKLIGRWRFARSVAAVTLLTSLSVAVVSWFLANFESSAGPILPLRQIMTRPLHLLLIWGVVGMLVMPTFFLLVRDAFKPGNWSLLRLAVSLLTAFCPVMISLQPIWGTMAYAILLMLFALHQAGYRLPQADEALFAYNPRATLIVGTLILVSGLLFDGIVNNERSISGEILTLDRLLVVLPMAMVVGLALYSSWTLAHKDSESMRHGTLEGSTNGLAGSAPALFILAVAAALIMGVELFYVSDVFGPRQNTVFKLYYQAWLLMGVLGGFGVWYLSARWDRRRLPGRIGVILWSALLITAFGAVSYYPFAAITTRSTESDGLQLDGLAYLEKADPSHHALIAWIQANTPGDAIVLESARVPCAEDQRGCTDWKPELGRIAGATGRPTLIGWAGHERQWRSSSTDLNKRISDVERIYTTEDLLAANQLMREYGINYVVVGPIERSIYGTRGMGKFEALGSPVYGGDSPLTLYQITGDGLR